MLDQVSRKLIFHQTSVGHNKTSFDLISKLLKVLSYGRDKTATVKILESDSINWTKNQENGTIKTHTINLGRAFFSS